MHGIFFQQFISRPVVSVASHGRHLIGFKQENDLAYPQRNPSKDWASQIHIQTVRKIKRRNFVRHQTRHYRQTDNCYGRHLLRRGQERVQYRHESTKRDILRVLQSKYPGVTAISPVFPFLVVEAVPIPNQSSSLS
jgi:hypothetical protein